MTTPIPILQGRYLGLQKQALATTDLATAPKHYALATSVLTELPDDAYREKFVLILGQGAQALIASSDATHEDKSIQELLSILKRLCTLTDSIGALESKHFERETQHD